MKTVVASISVGSALFIGLLYWILIVPPYNRPVFKIIDNNQTGFIIPMDYESGGQVKFNSADFLRDKQVPGPKRIQVERRWIRTSWVPAWGEYQDLLSVVVVDRTPVVREWIQDADKGTSASDDALEATSKDGVAFSIGFTCTAMIPEDRTAEFLYTYKGDQLAKIMDQEFRARAQTVVTKICAKYTMDHLRGHQEELVEAVKEDMTPFFLERGIQITCVGVVGGFHYKNHEVQRAIDKTVQDQQLKVSAEAQAQAQEKQNDRIRKEAEGKRDAAEIEAQGQAKAIRVVAEAKAFEMQQAMQDKQFYLTLKQIELETQRLKAWDGKYPQNYMNLGKDGLVPNLLLPVPEKK